MTETVDSRGSRFGMWLFLCSEVMLFGSLFILYAAYYHRYRDAFAAGGKEMDLVLGLANTVILLTSSFAVASSLTAVRRGSAAAAGAFLAGAAALGIIFLGIKYHEWGHKISAGIYPGSPELAGAGQGKTVFYSLYFTMTGLHALHVFIGIVVLSVTLGLTVKGRITAERHTVLENAGLYWHLVDILWIFIFPLLYLII